MTTEEACGKCGIDLSEVVDRRPQINVKCNHDGSLGLVLFPDETSITVHPGDALEIRWQLNYPRDGGPPTITEIGWEDGHWGEAQGDNDRALPGDAAGAGARERARKRTLDSYASEGASPGVVPDSFEKLVGYRAWIITDDGGLRSTAHRDHVWNTDGPEVAVCQRERDGHHVSLELFRLREEAALVEDPVKRAVVQSKIDHEIMVSRRSPERNCQCGIYAVHDAREIVSRIGEQEGMVYGRIKAWGKVADYDKGFRAEKVEIDALFRPRSWSKRHKVARIAKRYGVPVEAPPFPLPDPDALFSTKFGIFWGGFLGIGVAGWMMGGLVGYVAATITYSFASFVMMTLFGKLRK